MNIKKRELFPKLIFLVIVLVPLFLYFSVNIISLYKLIDISKLLPYNEIREVFAQEEEPAVCEKTENIDLPYITEIQPLWDNIVEIPIGKATEKIESVAEMIISEMPTLITAAGIEAQAAERMSLLISQCGIEPYICSPDCSCKFFGYTNCECSSSDVSGKDKCSDESLCPGGDCGGECNGGACKCATKCDGEYPCEKSDAGCGFPLKTCCKKEDKDCYCTPVFICEPCVCTCAACGTSPLTCPDSPGCPASEGPSRCKDSSCPPDACPVCPLGIDVQLQEIMSQAEIIRITRGIIIDPFLLRFKPTIFYGTESYSLTYIENWVSQYYNNEPLESYIDISGQLRQFLIGAGWIPGTPVNNLDQVSKDLCHYLCYVAVSPWCDGLCISPVEIEVGEGLKKSRERLVACELRPQVTEEEALEIEYTGLISCENILSGTNIVGAEIPVTSFLKLKSDHYGLYEIPGLRRVHGCFGNTYCQAEEKSKPCAEDYYCCQ